jgi:hypothetical protein
MTVVARARTGEDLPASVVACCDPPPVLEPPADSLDPVASLAAALVILDELAARCPARTAGPHPVVLQRFPEPVSAMAPDCRQPPLPSAGCPAGVLADLACGHEEADRAVIGIRQPERIVHRSVSLRRLMAWMPPPVGALSCASWPSQEPREENCHGQARRPWRRSRSWQPPLSGEFRKRRAGRAAQDTRHRKDQRHQRPDRHLRHGLRSPAARVAWHPTSAAFRAHP